MPHVHNNLWNSLDARVVLCIGFGCRQFGMETFCDKAETPALSFPDQITTEDILIVKREAMFESQPTQNETEATSSAKLTTRNLAPNNHF